MKHILCYGDSNTFGSNPDGTLRFDIGVRWTSRLAQILGDGYRIIEEGCEARTTVWEDTLERNTNGYTYLPACLSTHKPLDLVMIMLGTNDLKTRFSLPVHDIADGAALLAKTVLSYPWGNYPTPQVLLIAPIHAGEGVDQTVPCFGPDAPNRSLQFSKEFARAAKEAGCAFFDASKFAEPSPLDHLHMDPASHESLANGLADKVKELLG